MTMQSDEDEYPENARYNEFPASAEEGFGTAQGYNTYLKLNDPDLFDPAKVQESKALQRFLQTRHEISISFVAWKSSTRESEWALHKPHLTMDKTAAAERPDAVGLEGIDIEGSVDKYPGPNAARISTFVINHDATLARLKQSVIVMENGQQAGQMIYKHPPSDDQAEEEQPTEEPA
jgi:hypothetical protein